MSSPHQRPLGRSTRRGFRSCWIKVLLRLWSLLQRHHRQTAARMATRIQNSTVTRRKVMDKQIPLFKHILIEIHVKKCSFDCLSETVVPTPVFVPEPEVEAVSIPVVERPIRSRGKAPVTSRTHSGQHNRVRKKPVHYAFPFSFLLLLFIRQNACPLNQIVKSFYLQQRKCAVVSSSGWAMLISRERGRRYTLLFIYKTGVMAAENVAFPSQEYI